MTNWDCDPEFWSVTNGALFAKSTAEKPAGSPQAAPGGGVARAANPRNVGGYQYDFNAAGQYPGQLYENGGDVAAG
ncbi:MAG: hypothetical protein ACRD2N_13285 [Vicinamibacterales bacterium]